MFDKLKLLFVVLHQGEELANAGTWKNRQAAASALVVILGAIVPVLPITISQDDLLAIAGGIAAVGGVLNAFLTLGTSSRVGLPTGSGNPDPTKPAGG